MHERIYKIDIPGKLLTGATLFLTGAGGARVVAILCVVVLLVVVGILWNGRRVVVVVVVPRFLDKKYAYDRHWLSIFIGGFI